VKSQASDDPNIFKTRSRDECQEWRLVLVAAGISVEPSHRDGWWFLSVKPEDSAAAAEEIAAYRSENQDRGIVASSRVPIYRGAYVGVIVYCGVIILVAAFSFRSAFEIDWLSLGRVETSKVSQGQFWRVITALTLHLDVEHLLSNLLFGTVFGLLAGRVFGGGIAWLGIVIAGALGNYINTFIQPPNHTSIGASTSVFAALALITSHSLVVRPTVSSHSLIRWGPMIGGVLLLAMLGVGGERTDVAAHFAGFLSGLAIGWIASKLPKRWLASENAQVCSGVSAIAMIAFAWILAVILGSQN